MAYRIKSRDNSAQATIRRVAGEQIDKALASISELPIPAAVHDVRKRCKKIRGLVRLVRPVFDGYSSANSGFRDVARTVGQLRDARVMEDTYDDLLRHFDEQVKRSAFDEIRCGFADAHEEQGGERAARALGQAREGLLELREYTHGWKLGADGGEAFGPGFSKTYRRARKAAGSLRKCPSAEGFHEMRKHIKYHWYHCRLLEPLWVEALKARQHEARRLGEILGEHHDLAVFEARMTDDPEAYGGAQPVEAASGLARGRRVSLEEAAWPLAERLLAEPPKAMDARFAALWDVWRG